MSGHTEEDVFIY